VKQSGPYIGRECLNLKSLKTEKTKKLSLSNTERRDESGFHDMVANPKDTLCIVRIYKKLRSHYPDDYKGSILRRPIPQKEVVVLQKTLGRDKFVPMADLSKKGKFGKNYTTVVCRRVATRCGFENAQKHTAAGRRRTGITELVSSDTEVPSSELLISSRHKSVCTSAKYQATNENAHAKRYQATMYDEPEKGKVPPLPGADVYCLFYFLILTNYCTLCTIVDEKKPPAVEKKPAAMLPQPPTVPPTGMAMMYPQAPTVPPTMPQHPTMPQGTGMYHPMMMPWAYPPMMPWGQMPPPVAMYHCPQPGPMKTIQEDE
jgi:hypothetical protein